MVDSDFGAKSTIDDLIRDFAENGNLAILGENEDESALSPDFAEMNKNYDEEPWFPALNPIGCSLVHSSDLLD